MGICISSNNSSIPLKTETIDNTDKATLYPSLKLDSTISTSISSVKSTIISSLINSKQSLSPGILLLKEINTARINPKAYSIKISNLQSLIKYNPLNNKYYISYNDNTKIKIKTGTKGIKHCVDYLLSLQSFTLLPLIHINELKLPFPNNPELYLDKAYIKSQLSLLQRKYNHIYTIVNFHYDINTEPIASALSQIIDDSYSNYQRRYNIFNKDIKYISINYEEATNGKYIYYIVFAK